MKFNSHVLTAKCVHALTRTCSHTWSSSNALSCVCVNPSRKIGRERQSDPMKPSSAEPLSARDATRQEQQLDAANARIRALAFHIMQLQVVCEASACVQNVLFMLNKSRSRTLTRAPAHGHDATQAEEKRVVSLLQAKCSSLEKELGEAKRNGAVSITSSSPADNTSSVATSKSAATCAPHLGLGGDVPGQEVGGGWMEVKTPSRDDDDNADLQECQGEDSSCPITKSSPSAACIAPVSPITGICFRQELLAGDSNLIPLCLCMCSSAHFRPEQCACCKRFDLTNEKLNAQKPTRSCGISTRFRPSVKRRLDGARCPLYHLLAHPLTQFQDGCQRQCLLLRATVRCVYAYVVWRCVCMCWRAAMGG